MHAPSTPRHASSRWPRLTVRGLFDTLVHADVLYRERRNLERLDDHLLRDIGISRADVDHALRRPR